MYYFIVNPNSKTGRAGMIWNELEEILKKREIDYSVFFTEKAGDATEYARKISSENTDTKYKLVMVGGDGTANEIINGIEDFSNVIIGYIPAGSSNDLARGLKIPKKPITALENIILPQHFEYIDQGVITYYDGTADRRFAVSSGIGYDAEVCNLALTSKLKLFLNKLRLGKLVYILLAVKQIFKNKPTDMELKFDNGPKKLYHNVIFVANMIHKCEGGGLLMAPNASATDKKLSLCIVNNMSKLKVLLVMPFIFSGKHTRFKGISIVNCTSVEITANEARILHADGEYAGCQNHVKFSCAKDRACMFVSKDEFNS